MERVVTLGWSGAPLHQWRGVEDALSSL